MSPPSHRYLDAQEHRTRFNNFFLVQRWDPKAALRQKARELLSALSPQPGDPLYLIIDDSKKAKRGKFMDAIATMKDPTSDASIRGHQYVYGSTSRLLTSRPLRLRISSGASSGKT